MFECETCHASKTGEGLWAEGHKWDKESNDKNDPPTCSVCHKTGKYIGDVTITFTGSPYFVYTGGEIRAEHTVKDGDKVLSVTSDKQGADGLATYQNNKNVGMATLHIDGRGDYYGSAEANFYIIPADVPAVRITKQDKTSVTLAWDKAGGAKFYSVFRKDAAAEDKEGNWTLVTTTYETTYKVEDLTFGESYQFRVDGRANITVNGEEKQLPSANWTYSPEVTLAHQWDEPGTVTEPTCTEQGTIVHTCRHCGEEEITHTVALGHDVADWTVTKEPTIEEAGTRTGYCSRCEQNVEESIPSLQPYAIVLDCGAGGTVTTDPAEETSEGIEVTVTAEPDEDYELEKLTVTYEDGGETVTVPVEGGKFAMPAFDVTITAAFKRTVFDITVSETENGVVTAPAKARAGETVTLTATPAEGYELDQLSITYEGSILRSATQVLEGNTFTMPESDVTITAAFSKFGHKIKVVQPQNGTVSVAKKAPAGETVTVTATPNAGYALDQIKVTYRENGEEKTLPVTDGSFTMPETDVTVTATFRRVSSGGTSSSGTTVKQPDGTTVKTETKPDGTKVETTTSTDGKTTSVETKTDGTKTTTEKDAKGNESTVVEKPDGSKAVEAKTSDGTTATATVTRDGQTEAEVKLSAAAVQEAEKAPIVLPIPEVKVSAETPATIKVSAPATKTPVRVTVPVETAKPSAVAILVQPDGTETIIKKAVTTEDGLSVPLEGGATIKIVDNEQHFTDVKPADWSADAVAFVSSRELFRGVSESSFAPTQAMDRAMLVTVLHRLEDTPAGGKIDFPDVSDGSWYADAVAWASERDIVKGLGNGRFAPEERITREQLAAILYRYAGSIGAPTDAAGSLTGFRDGSAVSGWASDAMSWAVGAVLMNGKGNGRLDPKSGATRAEVASILQRFCTYLAK